MPKTVLSQKPIPENYMEYAEAVKLKSSIKSVKLGGEKQCSPLLIEVTIVFNDGKKVNTGCIDATFIANDLADQLDRDDPQDFFRIRQYMSAETQKRLTPEFLQSFISDPTFKSVSIIRLPVGRLFEEVALADGQLTLRWCTPITGLKFNYSSGESKEIAMMPPRDFVQHIEDHLDQTALNAPEFAPYLSKNRVSPSNRNALFQPQTSLTAADAAKPVSEESTFRP